MKKARMLHNITNQMSKFLDLFDENYLDFVLMERYYYELCGKINLALTITTSRKTRTQLLAYLKQIERHYKVAKEFIYG